VKTLIFDFDGTIADSFETLLAIFEEVTKRPAKLTAAEVNDLRGQSLKEIIRYLEIKHWRIPRLVLKAKRQLAVRMGYINLFPGMKQSLIRLSQNRQIYILSTNSSENIKLLLQKNGLDKYITRVYGDIGLRSKSSALKNLIRKEKLKRSDCIYIGDEVRDIEAAKKAKVASVAVAWGFNYPKALYAAEPDALANTPKDLVKFLEKS